MVDILQVCVVAGKIASYGHAACIMVGGDDYQGLVGMSQIEVVCHFDSLVEIKYLFDYSTSVVGMSGMVYVAAFDHHEEFLGRYFFKVCQTCFSKSGQGHCVFEGVDCISDFVRAYLASFENSDTFGLKVFQLVEFGGYLDSFFLELFQNLCRLAVVGAAYVCAAKEFVTGCYIVFANVIPQTAVGYMGIKRTRSGVVGCY